jgi:lysophospholipase L1-like esterase
MDYSINKTNGMTYSYLALGDSYTIGEQVLLAQSFPYQTVQLLRQKGFQFYAPEIIATTGHTTDELENSIVSTQLLPAYKVVSLLIGVNNQYRGRSVENFEEEFDKLLQKAIHFAEGNPNFVFVLSIPDWGVTPFAADRDIKKIAIEIDQYNAVCKRVAQKYQVNFIDITTLQRVDGYKDYYLAADKLHPSGLEYAKWATVLSRQIIVALSK